MDFVKGIVKLWRAVLSSVKTGGGKAAAESPTGCHILVSGHRICGRGLQIQMDSRD